MSYEILLVIVWIFYIALIGSLLILIALLLKLIWNVAVYVKYKLKTIRKGRNAKR